MELSKFNISSVAKEEIRRKFFHSRLEKNLRAFESKSSVEERLQESKTENGREIKPDVSFTAESGNEETKSTIAANDGFPLITSVFSLAVSDCKTKDDITSSAPPFISSAPSQDASSGDSASISNTSSFSFVVNCGQDGVITVSSYPQAFLSRNDRQDNLNVTSVAPTLREAVCCTTSSSRISLDQSGTGNEVAGTSSLLPPTSRSNVLTFIDATQRPSTSENVSECLEISRHQSYCLQTSTVTQSSSSLASSSNDCEDARVRSQTQAMASSECNPVSLPETPKLSKSSTTTDPEVEEISEDSHSCLDHDELKNIIPSEAKGDKAMEQSKEDENNLFAVATTCIATSASTPTQVRPSNEEGQRKGFLEADLRIPLEKNVKQTINKSVACQANDDIPALRSSEEVELSESLPCSSPAEVFPKEKGVELYVPTKQEEKIRQLKDLLREKELEVEKFRLKSKSSLLSRAAKIRENFLKKNPELCQRHGLQARAEREKNEDEQPSAQGEEDKKFCCFEDMDLSCDEKMESKSAEDTLLESECPSLAKCDHSSSSPAVMKETGPKEMAGTKFSDQDKYKFVNVTVMQGHTRTLAVPVDSEKCLPAKMRRQRKLMSKNRKPKKNLSQAESRLTTDQNALELRPDQKSAPAKPALVSQISLDSPRQGYSDSFLNKRVLPAKCGTNSPTKVTTLEIDILKRKQPSSDDGSEVKAQTGPSSPKKTCASFRPGDKVVLLVRRVSTSLCSETTNTSSKVTAKLPCQPCIVSSLSTLSSLPSISATSNAGNDWNKTVAKDVNIPDTSNLTTRNRNVTCGQQVKGGETASKKLEQKQKNSEDLVQSDVEIVKRALENLQKQATRIPGDGGKLKSSQTRSNSVTCTSAHSSLTTRVSLSQDFTTQPCTLGETFHSPNIASVLSNRVAAAMRVASTKSVTPLVSVAPSRLNVTNTKENDVRNEETNAAGPSSVSGSKVGVCFASNGQSESVSEKNVPTVKAVQATLKSTTAGPSVLSHPVSVLLTPMQPARQSSNFSIPVNLAVGDKQHLEPRLSNLVTTFAVPRIGTTQNVHTVPTQSKSLSTQPAGILGHKPDQIATVVAWTTSQPNSTNQAGMLTTKPQGMTANAVGDSARCSSGIPSARPLAPKPSSAVSFVIVGSQDGKRVLYSPTIVKSNDNLSARLLAPKPPAPSKRTLLHNSSSPSYSQNISNGKIMVYDVLESNTSQQTDQASPSSVIGAAKLVLFVSNTGETRNLGIIKDNKIYVTTSQSAPVASKPQVDPPAKTDASEFIPNAKDENFLSLLGLEEVVDLFNVAR